MSENPETKLYINRELSWLAFNERVLLEADDVSVPLLERLKFLAIFFSNLDEFYMVRVGTLTDQNEFIPEKKDDKTGWDALRQLDFIFKKTAELLPMAESIYRRLQYKLKSAGIDIVDIHNMSKLEKLFCENCFEDHVKQLLSPQIIDQSHPFPFLKNNDTYLIISFDTKDDAGMYGIIPLSHLPQYFLYPVEGVSKLFLTADIVMHNAHKLFHKHKIVQIAAIRVTRNADIGIDEFMLDGDDDADFRSAMQKLLKRRRQLAIVRVQLSEKLTKSFERYICDKLVISSQYIHIQKIPLDFAFGFQLPGSLRPARRDLLFVPHKPAKSNWLERNRIIKYIMSNDLLLSFPFQSISPFIQLLYEAAENENVISIKISLYRIANNSKIVSALAYAAEKGKDVLCVLELRARFDEQNNIDYSKILQDAGCNVIYGLPDYKTHAKLCLITMRDGGKINYITQVGTGNYNEKTAEQYTDLSFITANHTIGEDAASVFRSLCMSETVASTKSLWVAPECYKSNLLEMIDLEIKRQSEFHDGYIGIKINSINDMDVMDKLISASNYGVKIELFVRGICCLRPGISGYTENIVIKSIVGRYLEHSRIFCFGQGPRQRLFIGSGDLLNRNTKRRVEVFAEVTDSPVKKDVLTILEACRMDNQKAWIMLPDGSYTKVHEPTNKSMNSQQFLTQYFANKTAELAAPSLLQRLRRYFHR